MSLIELGITEQIFATDAIPANAIGKPQKGPFTRTIGDEHTPTFVEKGFSACLVPAKPSADRAITESPVNAPARIEATVDALA